MLLVTAGFALQGYMDWKIENDIKAIDRRDATSVPTGVPVDDVRNLEVQKKCADQAKTFWKEGGYSEIQKDIANNYTNHYNQMVGKCFIEITSNDMQNISTSGNVIETADLWDAFEGIQYASYMRVINSKKNLDSVYICFIDMHAVERPCKTREEWDGYTSTYMGAELRLPSP